MFTIKHYFTNGENYQAYSAATYFVDRHPNADLSGAVRDPENARMEVGIDKDPAVTHPRINVELADGRELSFDVLGECFIENAAGKTIDVIRPRPIITGPSKRK